MSQNPDGSREDATSEGGFDSGLDYGAFASDEPDYPEDHLGEKDPAASPNTEKTDDDGAAAAPSGSSPAQSFGEQPTETISPYPEDQQPTPVKDAVQAGSLPQREPSQPAEPDVADTSASEQATTVVPPVAEQPTAALPVDRAPVAETAPAVSEAAATASPVPGTAASPAPGTAASPAPQPGTSPASESPTGVITGGAAPAVAPVPRDEEPITDEDIDEEVKKSKRGISRVFTVLSAIFTPLILIVAAVHVVASPVFLYLTYWRPGFPDDTGGWEFADRLLYGSYGADYLTNLANSRYLAELAPGGEQLFTNAEVSHMTDVKLVMWYATGGAAVLLLLVFVMYLMLRAWRPGGLARALFAGAWATLGILIGLAVVAILDWQLFFAEFHHLLFPQGNWQFASDSTLIRLYPEQFWIDAGIWIVALLAVFSLILLIATWPTKRRRARRAARLDEVHEKRREKLIEELNASAK